MTHGGLLMRLEHVFDSRLLVCVLAVMCDGGQDRNISFITGNV